MANIADAFNSGIMADNNLFQNQMNYQYQPQRLALANQQAQADLQKSNIFNQYYPQQLSLGNQLTSQQVNMLGQQNKWYPQVTQADINNKAAMNRYYQAQASLAPYSADKDLSPIGQMQYEKQVLTPLMGAGGGFGGMGAPSYMPSQPSIPSPQNVPQGTIGGSGMPNNLGMPNQNMAAPVSPFSGQGMIAPPNSSMQMPSQPSNAPLNGAAPNIYDQLRERMIQNQLLGMGKDPRFGSSRGPQGGTFTNPMTGEEISSPTNKQTSTDQAAISALQRVSPMIDTLMQTLPQFQTAGGDIREKLAATSNRFLGTNYSLPSVKKLGEAVADVSPESLMKAFGINVTDQAAKDMKSYVLPAWGESAPMYKARLIRQLVDLKNFQDMSKGRLSKGIDLTQSNSGQAPSVADTFNAVSNNAPSNPSAANVSIPQFKSKTEFRNWFAGLPPQSKQAVIMQLKGGK